MVSTRQRALSKKAVVTQTEGLPRDVAAQVSGCRDCLSLPLPGEQSSRETCSQVEGPLTMVAELKEEVERLRSTRACDQEIDWGSNSLV